MPLDDGLEGVDDGERQDAVVLERGDRGVAEPEPADEHVQAHVQGTRARPSPVRALSSAWVKALDMRNSSPASPRRRRAPTPGRRGAAVQLAPISVTGRWSSSKPCSIASALSVTGAEVAAEPLVHGALDRLSPTIVDVLPLDSNLV